MELKTPIRPIRRRMGLLLLATVCALGTACRIETKDEAAAREAKAVAGSSEARSFDPKADATAVWDSKVIPTLSTKAADFVALRTAMRANLAEAGASHGHRERGDDAPWNFVVRLKGRIVEADTESGAGKIGVDADGDGKADAIVQIGPVLRGTSLRDSLPFISFTAYTNQIEFAQLANAFNDRAYDVALKPLPRDKLQGRTIELLGTFTASDPAELPLITPVQLKLVAEP